MQLFITDPDFNVCARHLDDKRLNKIIIESAQIASTALWINNCGLAETLYKEKKIYLPTHEHHPLCVWASEHLIHVYKVLDYCFELCTEYRYRFEKVHKTESVHVALDMNIHPSVFKNKIQTWKDQPNCTTHHKHIENVYDAYKKELILKWKKDKILPTWTKRPIPKFFITS